MKTYSVTLPITGIIYLSGIEAETEEEAIDKALSSEVTIDDVAEWEPHTHIVQGNVFYGHTNEASAEEE